MPNREIAYNWLDRPAELTAQEALFVSRLQANEDAAYDELVRIYSASIYHVAYRMLGDSADASDVVQDIFLKVFRNIGGFKGEAALKTWIFKIAFSEILTVCAGGNAGIGSRRCRSTSSQTELRRVIMLRIAVRHLRRFSSRKNGRRRFSRRCRGSLTNIAPLSYSVISKVFHTTRSRMYWEFRWGPSNHGWRGLAPT